MKKINSEELHFYLWGKLATIEAIETKQRLRDKVTIKKHILIEVIHPHEFELVVEEIKEQVSPLDHICFIEYFIGKIVQNWREINYSTFSLKPIFKKSLKEFNQK